ncbi:MAG TPA: hypothetical protein VJA86_03130 [Candidatus Nanoarchaeia archaeon]|nr:hypothetical protein [Candidatus Nanoarchaeia archaeon]
MTRRTNPEAEPKKYVATLRTALSGTEDSIMKPLSGNYTNSTVGAVIDYLTDPKQLEEAEVATARSIKSEMSREYAISVNGKTATREDRVGNFFQPREHRGVNYQALEIEVASVQEGGLISLV